MNNSIWPIEETLTGTTTLNQNGHGSNGNEGEFHIWQSSRIGASPSGTVLYHTQDTRWGGMPYTSVYVWSVFSTTPANKVVE